MKAEVVGSLSKNRSPLKVESLTNKSIRIESLTNESLTRVESLTNESLRAESLVTMQMRSRPDRDAPVHMPPQSLDDMDGRGWEVRGWVANG